MGKHGRRRNRDGDSFRLNGQDYPVIGKLRLRGHPYLVLEELPRCLIAIDPTVPRKVVLRFRDEDASGHGMAREARVLMQAGKRCDSAPRVLSLCRQDGREYLVVEWVEGKTLAAYMLEGAPQRKPYFSPEHCHRKVLDLVRGLRGYHQGGIIHGDLKPENIVVTPLGRLKLIDFGMAWNGMRAGDREGRGTKYYAAPELWTGAPLVDTRADQFSLSCILYELLTKQKPYSKLGSLAVEQPRPPRLVPPSRMNGRVWARLDEVVARGLALRPDDRFENTQQWLDALEEAGRERDRRQQESLVTEAFRDFFQSVWRFLTCWRST